MTRENEGYLERTRKAILWPCHFKCISQQVGSSREHFPIKFPLALAAGESPFAFAWFVWIMKLIEQIA